MQAPAITRERLRELSRRRSADGVGLSLVFDLDPERFATPPARKSEITSVLDQAHRRAEDEELDHATRMALRDRLEGAAAALSHSSVYDGSRGLALFAGFGGESPQPFVLRLPQPAGPAVELDTFPLVRPLLSSEAGTRWCVVLISREEGRILLGDAFGLTDAADLHEEARSRHDQGGWSQARYQRAIDEDAREHFDRVAEAIARMQGEGAFDQLLIGGTEENAAGLRERLAEPVARATAGAFGVDIADANPDSVLAAARPAIEEHERTSVEESLARLRDQLGTGQAGAMGLGPVLEALNEQRVARLFAPAGLESAGTRCPKCDRLSGGDEAECPLDGTPTVRRERILDDAVRRALGDSADVTIFETAAEIPGGIAALTHY